MIFKKLKNTASTSVKGRKVATPLKNVAKSKTSTPKAPRAKVKNSMSSNKVYNIPSNVYPDRRSMRHPTVNTFTNISGHNGIVVKGTSYVQDLVVYSATDSSVLNGQSVCYCNEIYLSPDMLPGRPSLLAKAFTKFRFNKACLSYRGHFATDTDGEIFITYCEDSSMNPTFLSNRQIKAYMDSMSCSDSGPVYELANRQVCSVATPVEKNKFFECSKDHQNLEDVVQGKFVVATTNCKSSNYGELILDYELVLVDDEVSLEEIMVNTAETNNGTSNALAISAQTVSSGSRVALLPCAILRDPTLVESYDTRIDVGIYSVFIPTDVPANLANKIPDWVRAGQEFFATVTLNVAQSAYAATLFRSLADVATGSPITLIASIASAIASGWVQLTQLLAHEHAGKEEPDFWSTTKWAKGFEVHYAGLRIQHEEASKTKEQVTPVTPVPPMPTGDLRVNTQGERIPPRSLDRYYGGSPYGFSNVSAQ